MTLIVFYDNTLHDVVAPSRSLRLQVGRGENPEKLWMSGGGKGIFWTPGQARKFLTSLTRMANRLERGRVTDKVFFAHDIYDDEGAVLGVDLGVLCLHPYIAINDTRVSVAPEDICFLHACCQQAHFLCGGIGVAGLVPRTPGTGRPYDGRVHDEFDFQRFG